MADDSLQLMQHLSKMQTAAQLALASEAALRAKCPDVAQKLMDESRKLLGMGPERLPDLPPPRRLASKLNMSSGLVEPKALPRPPANADGTTAPAPEPVRFKF